MKCGKCGDKLPYKASTLQQELPDGVCQITVSGDTVTLCPKCANEFGTIVETHKLELIAKVEMWFKDLSFDELISKKRVC